MAVARIASVSGLRGVVGDGLDPVIVTEFVAAYSSSLPPGKIVVGNDGRLSAPVFTPAVISAVMATGHDVLDAGAVATPTLGRLVRQHQAVGGVQISASHNPPTYNGLKFFQAGGMVLTAEQGASVLDRLNARAFDWKPFDRLGKWFLLQDPDLDHLEAVLAIVDVERIRRRAIPVFLDGCHGAGGRLGQLLLKSLGCQVLMLGGQPDGLYDHPPEPTEENLSTVCRLVKASGAAVGFVQDPDADRLAIIDEMGQYIGEELTLGLAAEHRFSQAKGPLVLNLSTSRVSEEVAKKLGCPVWRVPVGEAHVVARMREVDAMLGGEGNGGVIDPRVGYVRDSFVAMALVLELMVQRQRPLSQLAADLPRFSMLKRKHELPKSARGVPALLDEIAGQFTDAQIDRRDGLRLEWPEGWIHARASNTEPIARVIAEASSLEMATSLADRVAPWFETQPRPERSP